MGDLKNEFSWSKSRAEKFERCLREYYLHHYAFWNGWENGAPDRAQRLYVLRKLQSRHSWPGSVVHDEVKRIMNAFAAGRTVYPDAVLKDAREKMRRDFVHSQRKNYWAIRKSFGLVEHEYNELIPREWWAQTWEKVERSIKFFFKSETLKQAISAGAAMWFPVDQQGAFLFEGTKIHAAPDFAFTRDRDGVLVDWKTGRGKKEDIEQLACYAQFAHEVLGIDYADIVGRLVYLDEGREVEFKLGESDVAELFRERARASIANMKAKLVNIGENIPKPEEEFPKTLDMRTCRSCAVRVDCWPNGVPMEEW